MKYIIQNIDINGTSVAEAIAALQAWETENPEATESTVGFYSDGGYSSVEISFYRPYTSAELEQMKVSEQRALELKEKQERETYERLKEKYGN